MSRLFRAWLIAVLLSFSACTGVAEWQEVDPPVGPTLPDAGPDAIRLGRWEAAGDGLPAGAAVRKLAHHDGHLFAIVEVGGASSLHVRPLEGGAWRAFEPEGRSASEVFGTVAVFDRALYVTTADVNAGTGALYTLRFADDPWKRIETAPALPLSALFRRSGELLVAASGSAATAGLYSSRDGGVTWSRRTAAQGTAAFFAHPVRALVASPSAQRLFAVGDASAGFGGLFSSDDAGATWTAAALKGEVIDLAAGDAYVLVSTTEEGEQRSDNYGSTFHPVSLGTSAYAFFVSGSRALAATSGGVFVSDDGGATWRSASEGLPSPVELRRVYLAGRTAVAAGPSGVFIARLQ
ncbi:MAG: sialidase family protein [Myxococcaceae bacterium]